MNKKVVVLGSTGSIGTQCLDVCKQQGFRVVALGAGKNVALLSKQAREFRPKYVVTAFPEKYSELKANLRDLDIEVLAGADAVEKLAALFDVDVVVNAITGFAGLRATLAALNAGNHLALANKEALVVGGELVMETAKRNNVPILPIDSEHSAIWQSMASGSAKEVKGVILTASGGPFYGKTLKELERVTLEDALRHPNWEMGPKITVDSATLMNKGLEFIEAMHLFSLRPDQIEVVVHRESVVHSAVEFVDGSVIAQLGTPDMRVAIQYALTYPRRLPLSVKPLSLTDYATLSFGKPDVATFSCLNICIEAGTKGGLAPAIVNGANEQAVELFLKGKIRFIEIQQLVGAAFKNVELRDSVTLDSITKADALGRQYVLGAVGNKI